MFRNKQLIAVLGAGSWGTALAIHLAKSGSTVRLWDTDIKNLHQAEQEQCNQRYLPNIPFPENIQCVDSLENALKNVRDILIVVPSFAFDSLIQKIIPYVSLDARILWATKGIDPVNCRLLSEIIQKYLPKVSIAVLSGPTFAMEVARGLPTAIVAASNDAVFAQDIVSRFNHHAFRVYTSTDLVGVQLGGAVKNVLAIAVGMSDGLHYGANARSALITRGLVEMRRLGSMMGAVSETFMGLSGVGDLVLTCTDNQSRNRRFGLSVGQGNDIQTAEKNICQVVEGVHTAKQVVELAKKYHIEMPICQQVYDVLSQKTDLKTAVQNLLSREPKMEADKYADI